MPVALMDSEDLGELIKALQGVTQQLQAWSKGAPEGAEHVQIEAVAKQFSSINREMRASGEHGEHLGAHLGAIAASLRAAADAIQSRGR